MNKRPVLLMRLSLENSPHLLYVIRLAILTRGGPELCDDRTAGGQAVLVLGSEDHAAAGGDRGGTLAHILPQPIGLHCGSWRQTK